jgi:cytochrome P450 family 110
MALAPGPRTPDLIQAIQFRARLLAYLDACAQRYGDIFTAGGNGASPSVYVSSPSVIQEMLAADHTLFEPFREDWAAGEGHQRERRLLTPPFHGERLRANADTIAGIACDVVDSWQAGEPFFVGPAMREITLRVIFRMMFDADEGERLQRLRHHFRSLMTSLNSPWRLTLFRLSPQIPLPVGAWRSPVATKEEIDRLIYEEIRERRARGRSTSADVLSLLMSADNETVRYAVELGYEVTVVKDATSDYSDEQMHAALDVNIPNYASAIVTTDQIVDSISSL